MGVLNDLKLCDNINELMSSITMFVKHFIGLREESLKKQK